MPAIAGVLVLGNGGRQVLRDGDRAMTRALMPGCQTGPFVVLPH
jgi:hypothetical protein